ncbi:MAG: diaminopimelate decarboxylase [Gammaproteobacteria bacterium]
MDHFDYRDGRLWAEGIDLEQVAAVHGTPCYVYSRATLEHHWQAFDQALNGRDHLVCYAVKANSNVTLLHLLARLGSGFDIVSSGELERVLHAGGDPAKVVFSGVGKSKQELNQALQAKIGCFNVESLPELERLNEVAGACSRRAPVSLRINPDVDPGSHPYISTGLKENKFGIDFDEALTTYQRAADLANVAVIGIGFHIGSQITQVAPFVAALERILLLVDQITEAGIPIAQIDFGGGLGVCYKDETPPLPREYLLPLLAQMGSRPQRILVEPGRAIAANAGILLTQVEYLKNTGHKNFAIVDAAMNDLLRPALYGAWQDIVPVRPRDGAGTQPYDVVGPVCESGDFLGERRNLDIQAGDLLAVRSVGAYGFTMSSNYNSRPRPAELLVDGDRLLLIRSREKIADLFAHEQIPGDLL